MPQAGDSLAHYRLTEKIGAGGMGEVWRAHDTSLERDVAVKILPDAFARDPDRLARFGREAKLLASLNHPHIAAVYGLHQQGGVHFLAMELVEGTTLGARLADGPLPVDEAVEMARQIADALETAHDSGVIHRDLKPDNVSVTSDGKAKVLDFGLAKALAPESAPSGHPSMSPTVTAMASQAGVILGTAAYMSPEQAKGKAVDRRADIWAFGAVLYEMLTGKMLCRGETVTETLATVMMGELQLDLLPEAAPGPVRRLLGRCLERDPRRRLRDVGEARVLLEDLQAGRIEPEPPGPAGAAEAPKGAPRAALALAALALVAGAAISWLATRAMAPATAPQPLRRFVIPVEEGGQSLFPTISPDGTRIAYTTQDKLWVRRLDRVAPQELATFENAQAPIWSPDGAWIAVPAGERVWKLPAEGGDPVSLATLPPELGSFEGHTGAWLEDGHIYVSTGELVAVPERGGDPVKVLDPEPTAEIDFHSVSPLPDGRRLIFVVHRSMQEGEGFGTDTVAVWDGTERRDVLQLPGEFLMHASFASGHLLLTLWSETFDLWAVPFDPDRLEVTGERFLVQSGAYFASEGPDGTLVFGSGPGLLTKNRLTVVNRNGDVRHVGEPRVGFFRPIASPDGSQVASMHAGVEEVDIWVTDLERGTSRRLSRQEGVDLPLAWTPDGEALLYLARANAADVRLTRIRVDGTGRPEVLSEENVRRGADISPDGRHLLVALSDEEGRTSLKLLPLDPPGEMTDFLDTPEDESEPVISRDGRLAAFQTGEGSRARVHVTRFPSGEGRWIVVDETAANPRFSPDGRELYFASGGRLRAVALLPDRAPPFGAIRDVSDEYVPFGYDPLPGGAGVVFVQPAAQTGEAEENVIAVVMGWLREFE